MTNVKLLRQIADAIEAEPASYDQGCYGDGTLDASSGCGTACCIAGWAVAIDPDAQAALQRRFRSRGELPSGGDIHRLAEQALALPDDIADDLFDPAWTPHIYRIADLSLPDNVDALAPMSWLAVRVLRAVADREEWLEGWMGKVERGRERGMDPAKLSEWALGRLPREGK